jgi:hypothetical protein
MPHEIDLILFVVVGAWVLLLGAATLWSSANRSSGFFVSAAWVGASLTAGLLALLAEHTEIKGVTSAIAAVTVVAILWYTVETRGLRTDHEERKSCAITRGSMQPT